MKIAILTFGWLAVLSFAAQSSEPVLPEALRRASATNGLAVVLGAGSNRFVVIPFDSVERYYVGGGPAGPVPLAFGSDGRVILWMFRASFLQPSELRIDSVDGKTLAVILPRATQFVPAALNGTAQRVAFWGTFQGLSGAKQLNWASFDFSASGTIEQTDGNCSWSPDGSSLAYEKDGQIYVFDIASGTSKRLMRGHDPSWGPDGKRMAYRAPDGRLSLATEVGAPLEWPLRAQKVTGFMRWSPDGRYLAFIQALAHQTPSDPSTYRLLIGRVSDGSTTIVRELGVNSNNFYWLVDYRNFCSNCTAGEPF